MPVIPVLPSMTANLTLSELETMSQQVAGLLVKGFATAPALHPSSPCVITLPILLDRFKFIIDRMAILQPEKEHTMRASLIRSNYGSLLDQLAAFVNSLWTDREIAKFESCSCAEYDREDVKFFYTTWNEVHGQELRPLERVIYEACFILRTVYCAIRPAKLEKKPRVRKRKEWPPSSSHLIPYGPQVAEAAFARWSHVSQNPITISIFLSLTKLCPTLASATKQSNMLLTSIVNLFIHHHNALLNFDFKKASVHRLRLIGEYIKDLHHILFDNSWIMDRAEEPEFFQSNIEHFTRLYYAMCSFVSPAQKVDYHIGERDTIIGTFAFGGMAIYKLLQDTPNEVPLHPDLLTYCEDMYFGSQLMDDGHARLVGGVLRLRYKPQCVEPSCMRMGKGAGVVFKLCSACKVVRYCSTTCQKADWRTHKLVCRPLKVLMAVSEPYVRTNITPDLSSLETRVAFMASLEVSGLQKDEIKRVTEYVVKHAQSGTQSSTKGIAQYDRVSDVYDKILKVITS